MPITPLMVRELYKESMGAHIKCENCGAREPLDAEFNRCGNCQIIPYCSRACQKMHWKKAHKQSCQKGNEEAYKLFLDKLTRRLDRFAHVYGPMVSIALSMRFSIEHLNDKRVTPRTHVMMVHMSELTDKDAAKPRLLIDKIDPKPMSELPEGHRKNLQDGLLFYQDSSKVMAYFLVFQTAGGPFLRPIMSSYQDNPFEYSIKRMKKMSSAKRDMFSVVVVSWIQSINDMAKGKRPDLFEAAKGN